MSGLGFRPSFSSSLRDWNLSMVEDTATTEVAIYLHNVMYLDERLTRIELAPSRNQQMSPIGWMGVLILEPKMQGIPDNSHECV